MSHPKLALFSSGGKDEPATMTTKWRQNGEFENHALVTLLIELDNIIAKTEPLIYMRKMISNQIVWRMTKRHLHQRKPPGIRANCVEKKIKPRQNRQRAVPVI